MLHGKGDRGWTGLRGRGPITSCHVQSTVVTWRHVLTHWLTSESPGEMASGKADSLGRGESTRLSTSPFWPPPFLCSPMWPHLASLSSPFPPNPSSIVRLLISVFSRTLAFVSFYPLSFLKLFYWYILEIMLISIIGNLYLSKVPLGSLFPIPLPSTPLPSLSTKLCFYFLFLFSLPSFSSPPPI